MKRKVGYIVALLVILAVVIVPAVCMHKFTSPSQQPSQEESFNANAREQGNPADQSQPAAGQDQLSSGTVQGQSGSGAEQGGALPDQQASQAGDSLAGRGESGGRSSGGDQQASPANNDLAVSTAPAQTAGNTAAEGGCRVGIAIVGKNGELLFGPAQVVVKKENKWGITALGALEATGVTYTTYPTWPDFVNSISGQACSGVSGWMYSVNGDSPMHMADKHPVKTGDKVIWWYSKSMDQPQPRWDDLV